MGVYLDGKLDFREHLQNMFKKINITISLLRKLQNNLPRASLITIYKSFVRPHLDYGDTLYDQTFNNSFHERLESNQYNVIQSPKYLFELIPTARQAYMSRHKKSVPLFNVKHDYFKNSFFHSTVIEWNKLDSNIKNSESLALFKKRILTFGKPCANSAFQ